jgi:uncharacterized protein YbjT (DUF2867 family)
MKKVIVIGANGSLATYVIEALKKQGDVQLSLFVRNKNKLQSASKEGCDIIEGDAMDYNSVQNALKGQDIV